MIGSASRSLLRPPVGGTTPALVNADAGRLPLAAGTVHAIVTSPPYLGLRAYQGDQGRDWPAVEYAPMPGLPPLAVPAMRCGLGLEPDVSSFIGHLVLCFQECKRVLRDDGTMYIVIGDSFAGSSQPGRNDVDRMYNSEAVALMQPESDLPTQPQCPDCGRFMYFNRLTSAWECRHDCRIKLPPGNLLAVPYRLLLALQGDGWTVRNDVVWHKRAPMPESVAGWRYEKHRIKVASGQVCTQPSRAKSGSSHRQRDAIGGVWQGGAEWRACPGCARCEPAGGYVLRRGSWRHTRSHESVLMLTKQMNYWADGERVREPNSPTTGRWGMYPGTTTAIAQAELGGKHGETSGITNRMSKEEYTKKYYESGRNPRSVLSAPEPLMALRSDLTDEQRKYVLERLANEGLL